MRCVFLIASEQRKPLWSNSTYERYRLAGARRVGERDRFRIASLLQPHVPSGTFTFDILVLARLTYLDLCYENGKQKREVSGIESILFVVV